MNSLKNHVSYQALLLSEFKLWHKNAEINSVIWYFHGWIFIVKIHCTKKLKLIQLKTFLHINYGVLKKYLVLVKQYQSIFTVLCSKHLF